MTVLRGHGECSRASLARLTGLSGTTVSSLIAEMTAQGVVVEVGRDDRGMGRTGRPGRLVQLVGQRGLVVSVDIEPDQIRAAVCDLSGDILAERCAQLDVDADADAGLSATCELVNELVATSGLARERLLRLVLSVPGTVDPLSGVIVAARLPRWKMVATRRILTESTGLPTVIENDADLCALAERDFGAARGLSDVIHVKASSGVGVGLVIGGRLHRGARGGAGEIGHAQVTREGEACAGGRTGCLESVATLPTVLETVRAAHPEVHTVAQLRELVDSGNEAAVAALRDAGLAIGKVVAQLCRVLAPQAVVVGGQLAEAGPQHLTDAVAEAVARYASSQACSIDVVPSQLGRRIGVLGAVAVVAATEVA